MLLSGKDAHFDASHSWARRPPGDSDDLGILTGRAFVTAGVGVLGHLGWWPGSAVIAGLAGAVLVVLWFDAWLTVDPAMGLAVLSAGSHAFTSF